ncbi:tectonic-1 isoform X2 [Heptranchias perlo]|uniref:tectonic-1 isoform X2 n=1 Tax=Heptranchias perlo TaxID=212740 RepID=UPI00355A2310
MGSSVSLLTVWGLLLFSVQINIVNVRADDNFTKSVGTSSLPDPTSDNITFFPFENSTDSITAFSTPTSTIRIGTGVTPVVTLPWAGRLPDLKINVCTLCVCNLLVEQCDINCCCDPDCEASDFSTFATCDVQIVTGDRKLCNQEATKYFLNMNKSETVSLINPSIFCIQTNNYRAGSSFFAPEVPTMGNFDSLMNQFGGFSFSTDEPPPNPPPTSSTPSGYQYGVPIKVVDGFLRLPAPLATSACTDNNPAGFLVDQATHCSRRIDIATDCIELPALNMQNYLNFTILPRPNANLNSSIPFLLISIILRSLNRTLMRLNDSVADVREPVLVGDVCRNVVLEVNYIIVYNDEGQIVNASAAFTLGAINISMVPIQQRFQISFTQETTTAVPFSGNPGYVVGLPLVAGFGPNASFGIIQSKNRLGQLTVIKSSTNQDCLQLAGLRTPVLFGYNLKSGCILQITNITTCHQWSRIITDVLIGQNFPQSVASFGNTPVQNVKDWVTIKQTTSVTQSCACEVPESLALEVKWTKYGSLINPQAKIVAVTQTIRETCILSPKIYLSQP